MTYTELESLDLPPTVRVLVHTSPNFQYETSLRWAKIYKGFKEEKIYFEVIIVRYTYGMKLRGFSIGAQPMNGFIERKDDTSNKYYDLLVYNRKLTDEEVKQYELVQIPPNYTVTGYNKIQEIFPNDIIIYRVDEFYEILGENAKLVAKEFGLTLFKRDDMPMVGVPVRYCDRLCSTLRRKYNLIVVNSYNDMKKVSKES